MKNSACQILEGYTCVDKYYIFLCKEIPYLQVVAWVCTTPLCHLGNYGIGLCISRWLILNDSYQGIFKAYGGLNVDGSRTCWLLTCLDKHQNVLVLQFVAPTWLCCPHYAGELLMHHTTPNHKAHRHSNKNGLNVYTDLQRRIRVRQHDTRWGRRCFLWHWQFTAAVLKR